jgi:hypothetical protein
MLAPAGIKLDSSYSLIQPVHRPSFQRSKYSLFVQQRSDERKPYAVPSLLVLAREMAGRIVTIHHRATAMLTQII